MRPLFSYVAAVRRDPAGGQARGRFSRLAQRLASWSTAFDHDLARVWVRRAPSSALGARTLGSAGCLLGAAWELPPAAEDLPARGWGAYVALSVDERRQLVRVLRDPTGRVECWALQLPDCALFFSHFADVHDLADPVPDLNWRYLAHHLNQDYLHGWETGLEGVTEVLPGEEVVLGGGHTSRRMAWRAEGLAAEAWASPLEAQAHLRTSAEAAVGAWARSYPRLLMDLSGGLDSSVVLGLVRNLAPSSEVIAINRVTPGGEGDEREYAREAARYNGVELFEQTPLPARRDLGPDFPKRLMRPRARVLPLGYDEAGVAAAERHETPAFFTGTGGDHLFYNSLPVSAVCDYLRHGGGSAGWLDCATALARLSGDTVWGVAAEALRRHLGRPETLDDIAVVPNPYLSEAARSGLDHGRYAHPTALAALAAAPPAKRRQIVFMLELQRHYYRYGRADACEETHPLISQTVMEAALRTPAHWFGAGGVQRGLARRAFADLLAPAIRERRSKGAIGVHWTRFLIERLPTLRDLLLGGRLAERGLLDCAALEAVLTPMGLAATQQFMQLSTCLSTELWIRQAEADRADALGRRAVADQKRQ